MELYIPEYLKFLKKKEMVYTRSGLSDRIFSMIISTLLPHGGRHDTAAKF